MKKQIACRVRSFKQFVDAVVRTKSEVCEGSQIKPNWRPDYYVKYKKCGKQMGIKKTG